MAEIEDIGEVYTEGAKKYADNSWQNIPDGFERYRAALLRHMTAYMKGERYDKETADAFGTNLLERHSVIILR